MEGDFTLSYLGSSVLSKATASGLGTIQKPLREKYFEFRKASGKKSKTKELSEVGLRVDPNGIGILTAGSHPGVNELFYDMSSISFFEAVRFTTIKGADKKLQAGFVPIDINRSPNTGSDKLFSPLDKKFHNFAKMDHPAVLALVMRKTTGVRALECHAFVCESEQEALNIVSLIGTLQMRRGDHGPRGEYQRQNSDPRYGQQMGPPPGRPDLIQTEFGEFGVYRGGSRQYNLSDGHFRGSQRSSDNMDPVFPRDGEGEEVDRYMGNAPRDLRDSRGNHMGPGPFGPPPGMYPERKISGEGDRYGPNSGPFDGNEEVRFRHERQRSNEIRHERQSSGELGHRLSDNRHERQRSDDIQYNSEYRHERQRSSELAPMAGEYRHERQRSGEITPRMDDRVGSEYGRQGRSETRQEGNYGHQRVMSPGRIPPATAPKPSRALSPGPAPRMPQEHPRGQPPHSPREERGPPVPSGPEYSISSLENRQESENRPKPVARVPPHLVAGVKVLPTGFQAALQKKQESPRSPRNSRHDRDHFGDGDEEEGPYDNAITRREFYNQEYRRHVKSEPEGYDLQRNARPDVLPQEKWDRQHGKHKESEEDYERVIRRDVSYNQKYSGGKGNRFSAPPDEHVMPPSKPWSYDEEFQKFSQKRDQDVPHSKSDFDFRDPSTRNSGGYKDNNISNIFSKMAVHNQGENRGVSNSGTDFEESLGYFP